MEENKLRRVLGFWDVLVIAAGQVIGAGVMSLTGIAIMMTGSGVTPAFIISSLLTVVTILPIAILGASMPSTGGLYRYTSRLLSAKTGMFWLPMFLLAQVTLAIYAISFAEYIQGIVPGVPIMPVAFLLLTALFIVNLLGVKLSAQVNKVMVILLIAALLMFIFYGMPNVDFTVFNTAQMAPDGLAGFFTAVGLVSFATGGAQVIAELGGEMKNPKRDIPLVMIVATVGVGIIYAFVATIAVGVLPIAEVAGQPLTAVANEILPQPLFVFFIVCGAMFALATTLNSTFTWITKSFYAAAEDGLLPKKLATVNQKFGTPHYLLIIFYLVGAVPILTGVSLTVVAQLGTGLSLFIFMFPVLALVRLPAKEPELYARSPFKLSQTKLNIIAGTALVVLGYQTYLLISDLETVYIIGTLIYILLSALFAQVYSTVKDKRDIKSIEVGNEF